MEEDWNLLIRVPSRINKILRWTLERYVFDVTLDSSSSILSIIIFNQNSPILSVTVFKNEDISPSDNEEKDIQIISSSDNIDNEEKDTQIVSPSDIDNEEKDGISPSDNIDNEKKDDQIINGDKENKEYKKFTYALKNPENIKLPKEYEEYKEFKRFIKFIESVSKDLDAIGNDDIDLLYIYTIFPLIFPKAIDIGEDYLVEAIIDKCITYYNDNYSECSPNILDIITTSYSKLHDNYPHYAKKFISTLTLKELKDQGERHLKHLESYSDHDDKNSTIPKIINYKLSFYRRRTLFELIHYIIVILPFLPLFTLYNRRDVVVSLILIWFIILFIVIFMGPQGEPHNVRSSVKLFIPFTKFASYHKSIQFTECTKTKNLLKKLKELLLIPTSDELSEFIKNHYPRKYSVITEKQARDLYSGWNGEALINFKWNRFALFYHCCSWFTFNIFYFIFAFSCIYPTKFLIIEVILGFFLLSFEVRKFIFNPKKSFWTELSYVSLGAYLFPTVLSIFYLIDFSPPAWILPITFLVMDARMIFFLVPFEIIGPYFAIIRHVAKRVFSFVLLLLLLIFAFAHAFFILLRPNKPFDPSTPVFDDNDPSNPWNMVSTYNNISPDKNISKEPSLIQLPNANTNLYALFNTSVLATYQLITGNTNSLDSFELNQNPMLVLLWFFYSFLIVIYLLNLFIGLLNNAIQETSGREFFLYQKAEIIAEIELFWLLPCQREWKNWFPDHIWYNVYVDELRKKIQEIRDRNLYKGDKPIIHPKILNDIGMQEQDDEKEKEIQTLRDEKEFYLKETQILRDEKEFYLKEIQILRDEKKI